MTKAFEEYLKELAESERRKAERDWLHDPRNAVLTYSGIHLNWVADYVSNPKSKWTKKEIPIEEIALSGTNPEWNKILLEQCERSPQKFKELLAEDTKIKEMFESAFDPAKDKDTPLLLRSYKEPFKYISLDGMHRFVRAIMRGDSQVEAFVIQNEDQVTPICEPHVVYDLLRAFRKGEKTDEDKEDLKHALRFLIRHYDNVADLLKTRFSVEWEANEDHQGVISEVLEQLL